MKKTRRFKLLLTPILISVLSLLMIVTTFSWYKVSSGGLITPTSSSVNVYTKMPEGVNAEITRLGDKCDTTKYPSCTNYKYDDTNQSYKINKETSAKDSFDGFFGQTGLGDYKIENERDKPYICFYEVVMSGYLKAGLTLTNAFIPSVVITKIPKDANPGVELFNNVATPWTFENTEFTIEFYDCVNPDSTKEFEFTNPHENLNFSMQQGNNQGTKFYFGLKYFKRNSQEAFRFSSIDYIDTEFHFNLKFNYNQTV